MMIARNNACRTPRVVTVSMNRSMNTTDEHEVSGHDVTVMVCAHNAATTIQTALASIAAQTVRPGVVLVIDDGSTDGTGDAARQWSGRLPLEIVRLTTKNGVSNARREATQRTHTDLVAILDADDAWLPDHLESMLMAYAAHGGVITAEALNWVPGQGVGRQPMVNRAVPPPDKQLDTILSHDFVFNGVVFARADYERVGGFRDLRSSEDWDLWIRMIRDGVRITRGDHPTVLYRISPTSTSFGHTAADADVQVLELALQESTSNAERGRAHRSLRRFRARLRLNDAWTYAEQQDWAGARAQAARALLGERRVAIRAAMILIAPRRAAHMRASRDVDLSGYLGH